VLVAPDCIREAYAAWALDAVPVRDIRRALAKASNSLDVLLGPVSLATTNLSSSAPTAAAGAGATHSLKKTTYTIEHRRWGQRHLDNLDTLALCAAVLLGMSMGVIMACALACTRLHRRRLMRVAFWRQRGSALFQWLRRVLKK
jgi:hypothetical protein